ncbi:MAG: type II secretion system protein GspD [Aridibacter sp.]
MKNLTLLIIILTISLSVAAQSPITTSPVSQTTLTKQNKAQNTESPKPVTPLKEDKSAARIELVKKIAKDLKFSEPEKAVSLVPAYILNPDAISAILRDAAKQNPNLLQAQDFCDRNFVGGPLSFQQTAVLTLDDLLYQIHNRFNINFLLGDGVTDLPINIRSGSMPWNTLLRSQLFLSGVRATCIGRNTIQLIKNDTLPKLQDTAEVETKFIKLKFLQPSSGGNVDIAGRSSGQGGGQGCQGGGQSSGGGSQGCGNFEKLIIEIEKILGIRSATSSLGGGGGGGNSGGGGNGNDTEVARTNRSVSQIPGRNILVVRATEDELALVNEIIERADRPPFQVIIKGLVYTANTNVLRDVGIQTTIVDTTNTNSFSGTDTQNNRGTLFNYSPSGLFDFSSLIGTVNFNVQASALEQKGAITIKSRPFAVVLDGDPTELEVGRQIPVLTQGSIVGGQNGDIVFLNAGNILKVTPHVIDDDNGYPVAVNLDIQLTSNELDTAVISQGLPAINNRSIQSRLILNQETTVILGGFTVDSNSTTSSKTPGLGDIPVLGYLFKRKVRSDQINRLYFALSVTVVPYGSIIAPVEVPGANTNIPSIRTP